MTAHPSRPPMGPVGAREPSGSQPSVAAPRPPWLPGVGHISYGGDYNPEQWPEEVWAQDMAPTRDGTVLGFGSRGMVSPSSPEYRRASVAIARELARRYGRHPALALWHVHNEYGAPVSEDYSPASAAAFRVWLERRYGTLDALNAAWGTAFWGQHYGKWEHIDVPAVAPSIVNPSQRLDFARFTNNTLLECFVAERDAIRAESDVPITTNF